MNRWFLSIFLCFCITGFSLPIQDRKLDPAKISELASALGISSDADILSETQSRWLRKPGQERWEMSELLPEQKSFVLSWAGQQGLFASWEPARETYDKALILGATTSHMQMRLEFLKQLWLAGTRFQEVVWLTGDRPLDPRIDGLLDRCSNESEAAHILWEEANLPEEMHALPVTFIAVPMMGERRPNTADTIIAWLERAPSPCSALFVSDQPFCGYQFAILEKYLPDSIDFDVVGKGADPSSHPAAAAITLDSIARWLYAERME